MAISRTRFMLVALTAMLLLVSACSSNEEHSSSPTSLQVLQKSAAAMKQLKSAHFTIQLVDTVNATSATPTTTPTSTSHTTINLTGNGDEVLPAKFALHIAVTQPGHSASTINMAEILLGRQQFIQNANGKWYVLRGGRVQASPNNPFAGTTISNYNNLLDLAQQAQIADHGDQALHGHNLRHLSVNFGENALKDLLVATGQLSPQQDSSTLLNQVTVQQTTLDLWIDEATSYVYRLELKLHLTMKAGPAHTSGSPAATPTPILTETDAIIDYSNFNESITISAPTAAIPTNNPVIP